MQSFVAYARSPNSEDFRDVIPRELQPGDHTILLLIVRGMIVNSAA